jgi:hypothetical protein
VTAQRCLVRKIRKGDLGWGSTEDRRCPWLVFKITRSGKPSHRATPCFTHEQALHYALTGEFKN